MPNRLNTAWRIKPQSLYIIRYNNFVNFVLHSGNIFLTVIFHRVFYVFFGIRNLHKISFAGLISNTQGPRKIRICNVLVFPKLHEQTKDR